MSIRERLSGARPRLPGAAVRVCRRVQAGCNECDMRGWCVYRYGNIIFRSLELAKPPAGAEALYTRSQRIHRECLQIA